MAERIKHRSGILAYRRISSFSATTVVCHCDGTLKIFLLPTSFSSFAVEMTCVVGLFDSGATSAENILAAAQTSNTYKHKKPAWSWEDTDILLVLWRYESCSNFMGQSPSTLIECQYPTTRGQSAFKPCSQPYKGADFTFAHQLSTKSSVLFESWTCCVEDGLALVSIDMPSLLLYIRYSLQILSNIQTKMRPLLLV